MWWLADAEHHDAQHDIRDKHREINVTDIIFIINVILIEIFPNEDEFVYCDLNEDNIINVLDIIAVVNIILG